MPPRPPLLLFAFRGGLQRTQTLGPEDFEGCPELGDGFRPRPVQALRPVSTLGHETGLFQDAKVLGDRGPGHVEAARDVADRELLARDETEDLAAPRFAKCGKSVDFWSVSRFLPSVKALGGPPSPIHDRITTDPAVHSARNWREPSPRILRGR